MSLEYKILGQLDALGAGSYPPSPVYYYNDQYLPTGEPAEDSGYTTVYTVPENTSAIISATAIANLDSSNDITYDLALVPAGEELGLVHNYRWDSPVAAGDFDLITTKITLSAGDRVLFLPSDVDVTSITVFGIEKGTI